MATLTYMRLLGAAELAALLGVSRQRVGQLILKPWFPAPLQRLTMGGVWDLADIEQMAHDTGRTLDYDALNALTRGTSSPGRSATTTTVQRKPYDSDEQAPRQ